jgi:hypothetical protein
MAVTAKRGGIILGVCATLSLRNNVVNFNLFLWVTTPAAGEVSALFNALFNLL